MEQQQQKEISVRAVMTAGRYENTLCRNHIEIELKKLGIPFSISLGVFYGQCMTMLMEEAIENGVEYIVTIDGDSFFKAEQLHRLLSIAASEDDIDALCAMQVRRGQREMLGARFQNGKVLWDGFPIELDSAHFGLTVLDAKKLASVARPWFVCKPDEEGRWSENKIDSDVWFWRQWKAAGLSIYCDPGSRIGHLEEMISTFDDQMNVEHLYPKDWLARS